MSSEPHRRPRAIPPLRPPGDVAGASGQLGGAALEPGSPAGSEDRHRDRSGASSADISRVSLGTWTDVRASIDQVAKRARDDSLGDVVAAARAVEAGPKQHPAARPQHPFRFGRIDVPRRWFQVVEAAPVNKQIERLISEGHLGGVGLKERYMLLPYGPGMWRR
jgi:hypothetical protein